MSNELRLALKSLMNVIESSLDKSLNADQYRANLNSAWEKAEAALAAVPQEPQSLTLTGAQLRAALDLIGDDMEQSVCIQHGPARQDEEGSDPEGLYCWIEDYPEEGSISLENLPAPEPQPSLLPCPFCGTGDTTLAYEGQPAIKYEMVCIGCGAAGPDSEVASKAWSLWNTRTAVPQEPVATLHDDGYFTWKSNDIRLRYRSEHAGWRMDVYAAPKPSPQDVPAATFNDATILQISQVLAIEVRQLREENARLKASPQAGRKGTNCGSTVPNLHSAEYFAQHERTVAMPQKACRHLSQSSDGKNVKCRDCGIDL